MIYKVMTGAVLALSVAVLPAERVEADAGDFIAGAIIGGIVGANAKNQRRTTTTRKRTYRKKSTRSSIPATQDGRNIQSSLNYFGFNAGAVDGQLGRKTRDAVTQYQAYLGYPMTGQLSAFEKNLLISSYNRAQAGGYATQQLVATTPDGTRGLLKNYRAEMAGGSPVNIAPAQLWSRRRWFRRPGALTWPPQPHHLQVLHHSPQPLHRRCRTRPPHLLCRTFWGQAPRRRWRRIATPCP